MRNLSLVFLVGNDVSLVEVWELIKGWTNGDGNYIR